MLILGGVASLYQREKREVIGKFGLALETIAVSTTPLIRGEDLDAIRGPDDAGNQAFVRVRAVLERVRKDNSLREDQVYVMRQTEGQGTYEFVVMLQAQTFIGDSYDPPPALAMLYDWVIREADGVRSDLYRDPHGSFISGLAPVQRSDGSVAGVLQVDYGVDAYLSEVDAHRVNYLMGLALMILIFAGFGYYINRRLQVDLQALMGGTEAIARNDYDHVVPVRTRDEIGLVAEALNRALHGLKERFEMLKFIPAHTARMIEAAAQADGVQRSHAKDVEVAVFMSDIRGFTRISEKLSAQRIVGMLNDYIRVQAELIEASGGSIDKYMGDAVMAIFEGEGKARRAVECALAVQRVVADMNDAGVFEEPILVGIGLTVGEVVMGNMGSDQRMEYTVIGSTVNLAARLCSAAAGGEVVISSELKVAVDGTGLCFSPPEHVEAKGFPDPVVIFRVTASSA